MSLEARMRDVVLERSHKCCLPAAKRRPRQHARVRGYVEGVDAPTIRPARPSDVHALSELATRTWSDAFGDGISPEDEAAELEETRSEAYFASALRSKTILVAEEDGALLGYVQFGDVGIPEVQVQPGDQALQRLYVEAALQGRGLGRRLMEAALRHPRLSEARRIFLQVWGKNDRAVRLYESLGFQKVGTTTFTIGSEVMEDLVMQLDRSDAAAARGHVAPPTTI
jgi:diamine N-acetyltransferase